MNTGTLNITLLETQRLILKGLSSAALHALFETKTDEDIQTFLGVDDKGLQFYRDMHEKGMDTFRISQYVFLLINAESKQPIGECGFHTWNSTHRRAELFYFLRHDDHKQKGYMGEALPRVLAYGFEDMNLHRIQAMVAPENTPSVKLLQKNGFTFEGTMRQDYVVDGINTDSDCYSLLRHEWEGREELEK